VGIQRLRNGQIRYNFYVLGYRPGSHRTQQVMIAGVANVRARTISLVDTDGAATLRHIGRTCLDIRYARGSTDSYYDVPRHRLVAHCKWRRFR
jgi:hypothetical protein